MTRRWLPVRGSWPSIADSRSTKSINICGSSRETHGYWKTTGRFRNQGMLWLGWSRAASRKIGSLNLSHIWTHPALQGQCLLMAVRGTTARIYPASCLEGRCPLRHDGICALPPQHFDDLKTVIVITRLRKSRSDLSRHQDILPYAMGWKGLCSVNTCAMHLLRCSPQALSYRCAPAALWSR